MDITRDRAINVCRWKPGPATGTCAFLLWGEKGPSCNKGTDMEDFLRKEMESKHGTAKGDHCSGPPDFLVSK